MSKHIKRMNSPRSWNITRKTAYWATKPRAGPHGLENSIPLLTVIRDLLGLVDTASEARKIIGSREVLVDGVIVTDPKRGLGLMDVLSIPKIKGDYRAMLDQKGRLAFVPIDKEKAAWKFVRINGKTSLRGGKTQLNMHDGRNLLLPKDMYRVGDVLKIELPTQKILARYEFKVGNKAYMTGGRHVGIVATIKDIEVVRRPSANVITFEEEFSTTSEHVFVVGTNVTDLDLPGVTL